MDKKQLNIVKNKLIKEKIQSIQMSIKSENADSTIVDECERRWALLLMIEYSHNTLDWPIYTILCPKLFLSRGFTLS